MSWSSPEPDELQGIKRGILELADIVAVNKADGNNVTAADAARAQYEQVFHLFRPPDNGHWDPRVLTCSALTGDGLNDVWKVFEEHRMTLEQYDLLDKRRSRQRIQWMWSMVDEALMEAVRTHPNVAFQIEALESDVLRGTTTASAAAEKILEAFKLPS